MKRIIISLSLYYIVLIFFTAINTPFLCTASAEKPEYLRVITEDTPFYSDENGKNFLFYLPYTYYVKLIDNVNNLAHVELISDNFVVDGYTPKELLFSDNLSVANPYPSIKIKTVNNTVFYSDINLDNTIQYIFPDRSLNYYGKVILPDETVIYYVSYNNKMGYVKEENISSFTISNHPNELTFIKKEEETVETFEQTEEKMTDTSLIRIMIILCLLVSAVLTVFIVIKRKPQPSSTIRYYDENDYE